MNCENKHNYFHMVDILLCKETLEIIQMSNLEKLKTKSLQSSTWKVGSEKCGNSISIQQ